MIRRKVNSRVIFFTISLGLLLVIQNYQLVKGYYPVEFYPGETISWEIKNISSGNNQWYNSSTWTFITNWYAEQNDTLTLSINDLVDIDSKNYLNGLLTAGNLSLETNNRDIGFNLALSIYPWYGGLISVETDWDLLKTTTPFNDASVTINTQTTTSILGVQIDLIRIHFNDSFQTSDFAYEKYSGILIYANTSVGLFNLELLLSSTSIPLPSITQNVSLIGVNCVVFGIVCVFLGAKLSRKKNA